MELLNRDRYAQKPRARETAGWGAFRVRAPGCGGALESETQPEKARQDREMIAQGLRLPDYSLRNPGLRYLLPKLQGPWSCRSQTIKTRNATDSYQAPGPVLGSPQFLTRTRRQRAFFLLHRGRDWDSSTNLSGLLSVLVISQEKLF